MPRVVISGANRGLGFEFVRQYAADGWEVVAGCRDPGRADALQGIAGVRAEQLEVGDPASIAAFGARLAATTVDLLINNAGIFGSTLGDTAQTLEEIDPERWLEVLRINTIAPLLVTRALLPTLGAGSIVAMMSSGLGSIAENNFGELYAYRSSKAGLNMVAGSLAIDLKPRGIAVAVLHPGWASTDMGGPTAPVDPVESIRGLRRVLAGITMEKTGSFTGWDGNAIPW